jgi:hypothetical protein
MGGLIMRMALLCITVFFDGSRLLSADPPSLIYSLPPDGSWVEYKMQGGERRPSGAEEKATGILRISSVGKTVINGVNHRWVEIKLQKQMEISRGDKKEEKAQTDIKKLLIAERPRNPKESFRDLIVEGYGIHRAKGTPVTMERGEIDDIMSFGTAPDELAAELDPTERETTIPLGKFRTRLLSAKSKERKGERQEVRYWLSDEIPFGWAKMEIAYGKDERGRLEAIKTGKDAKSELDESKAK